MFWRGRSIREGAGLTGDGEEVLNPVEGLADAGLLAHMNGRNGHNSALARNGSPQAGGDGAEGESSGEETGYEAQQSDADGVREDMATLVLHGEGLGGSELRPGTPGMNAGARPDLDPTSDAAIMLRVAAGDEDGFTYLARKYQRPMIHFLFRMVGNQAIAEELAQEVFLRVYRARESYRAEARF